jgi:hypothetical protein
MLYLHKQNEKRNTNFQKQKTKNKIKEVVINIKN